MSLHLANLSPRMRKDELERVFRKFGRCTVQLKDGFGFAVYEYRGDAEEALRSLKGRKICGESVYLSWSNKQPKPLQRFTRAARSHEMRYGRNSDRGDNFVGRGDYPMSDKKQPDKGRERHKSPVTRDDKRNFKFNDAGLVHYDQREVVVEQGFHVEVEPTHMDDGRWGEQVDSRHNDTGYDGQMGFDRYDPDRVDDRGEVYESRASDHFAGSHSVGTSPDKKRIHRDNKRGQLTCFKCGAAGHKMRDCPSKEALPEKSTYHSDHRDDTKAKNDFGRAETRPREHLQSSSRNLRSKRQSDTDRKLSHSENDVVNRRSSPEENESRGDRRKDYNRNRKWKGDDQIIDSCDDKKLRVSALSHLHSNHISPELGSYSRPSKPLVEVSSHLKSGSPRPHSLSVRSRSNSRSRRSRSRSFKTKSRSRSRSRPRPRSRSKSRSRSPSSSLSISLGQSLPSSPNKADVNLNGFSEGPSPLSKEVLTEVRQHVEPEVREENMSIANREEQSLIGYSVKPTSYQIMEIPTERKQSEHDIENLTATKHTGLCLNGFVEDCQSPQYQEAVLGERQRVEPVLNFGPPLTEAPLRRDVFSSAKVVGDMKLDPLLNDAGSDSISAHVFCEVEAPRSSLLEKDDNESAAVKISVEKSRESEENENSNALGIMNSLEPAKNSDVEAPSKLNVGSHLSISSEELSRVLKHYGLKHPEENEQHLDVGDYFGSSRLWPWEMVYYRRLKKGPISVENYARRVAQNEAFRITDKYIRSSSGWGEPLEEHC